MEEVMAVLGPMVERTREERGCSGCELHRDALEENVLAYEEWWETEEDLERHLRSEGYRTLLLVMEMARVPPEVAFETVSHVAGIEKIERARE
jgi:quinol monooxygenase YgiN